MCKKKWMCKNKSFFILLTFCSSPIRPRNLNYLRRMPTNTKGTFARFITTAEKGNTIPKNISVVGPTIVNIYKRCLVLQFWFFAWNFFCICYFFIISQRPSKVLIRKKNFKLFLFVCLFVCFQGRRKRVNDGYFEDESTKRITEVGVALCA